MTQLRCTALLGFAAFMTVSLVGVDTADAHRPRTKTYKVYRNKLGRGSSPSGGAYKYIKKIGCLDRKGNPSDDAGHIVAKSLGGRGGPSNIFPQHPGTNRGRYRSWERTITKLVAKKKRGKFVYAQPVVLTISFNFGNRKLPDRPTGVRYCYAAKRMRGSVVKKCKTFGNPQPSQCFAPSALGGGTSRRQPRGDKAFDALLARAKAFIVRSKRLRSVGKSMPKRYINNVCRLDAERRGGPAWSLETRMYERMIVRRIRHNYDALLRDHKAIMSGLKRYKRGAKSEVARRWHRNMADNFRTVRNVMDGNLFAGLKPQRQAALQYNARQHERMQRKWGCEKSSDGTERKPDCIDYDKCLVLEFAPSSTRDRSMKRAQAIGAANRMNGRARRNRKLSHCFSKTGPTRGKGLVGAVKVYRACR